MVALTRELLHWVGSRPFEQAVDDVKQLAGAVWYRGYRPTREELEALRDEMPLKAFQRTLCVLELLSQYPVCRQNTARHLQQLTRLFHRQLLGGDDTPSQGRYSPSQRWGLSETTTPLRKALLPLQTRTYADSTGHPHGLSG